MFGLWDQLFYQFGCVEFSAFATGLNRVDRRFDSVSHENYSNELIDLPRLELVSLIGNDSDDNLLPTEMKESLYILYIN